PTMELLAEVAWSRVLPIRVCRRCLSEFLCNIEREKPLGAVEIAEGWTVRTGWTGVARCTQDPRQIRASPQGERATGWRAPAGASRLRCRSRIPSATR